MSGALIATFILPFAVYAFAGPALSPSAESIMAALLVLSLPFFSYVAGNMNKSAIMLISFRPEMDALLAEVETARSISDEARWRAEEANLAKSRFLASMSHELRTPLNAILGFSEVMASEVLGSLNNPTYRDYARDIHGSGQHLLDVINEILDLSRIEAGRYQLNEEPMVILDTVEECCRMMELKARNKNIRLVRQFEIGMPRLFADTRAVRQIVLNLLSNAVKFTGSGGEILVRVGWTAGGGQYVSVKDNGPGIPEDEIPIVLSAFGQGSIAIKSAEQGTGLAYRSCRACYRCTAANSSYCRHCAKVLKPSRYSRHRASWRRCRRFLHALLYNRCAGSGLSDSGCHAGKRKCSRPDNSSCQGRSGRLSVMQLKIEDRAKSKSRCRSRMAGFG